MLHSSALRLGRISPTTVSRSPLHRAADRFALTFAPIVTQALLKPTKAVQLAELEAAMRAKDQDRALLTVLPHADEIGKLLTLPFSAALKAGGNAASFTVSKFRSAGPAKILFRFDAKNQHAIDWAKEHAAELVTEVTDGAREAVRSIVERAFEEGIPPRESAQFIRDAVGLTEPQANAVANLYYRVSTAVPGAIVQAGSVPIRVPSDLTEVFMDRIVSQYADRLLRSRANIIASNESMTAANEGQRQAWGQAIESGLLSGKEKKQLIQVDPCPQCLAMSDEIVGIDEEFSDGLPPFHVNCECLEGIVA